MAETFQSSTDHAASRKAQTHARIVRMAARAIRRHGYAGAGVADINTDDLVLLFGMLTAIKDGDTTPEQAFAADGEEAKTVKPATKAELPPLTEEAFNKKLLEWTPLITGMKKTATQAIDTLSTKNTLTDEQKAAIKKIEADMNPEGN